jgi:ADP-heptose:LPS heptosyltransferase
VPTPPAPASGRPVADERILVIRLGAVGDVVRTLPAVAALRAARPRAWITWLVEPAAASVLVGQPSIDEVCVFPRGALAAQLRAGQFRSLLGETRAFVSSLRARRFDLALDFHSLLRSALLSRLSGAPVRVAFAPPFGREGAHWFANHWVRLPDRKLSRFDRNAALVESLGIDTARTERHSESNAPPVPALALNATAVARIAAALGDGPAPVAIHPGSSDATAYKRYTVGGFAEVAQRLADGQGTRCLVSSGPARGEAERADAIVAAANGAAVRAPETPTLADLAALFAASRLVIAGDTGPLHIASLVGTPVVQLLGPTDPIENAPWRAVPARSVSVGLACSPCRRGCAAATCMSEIEPAAVATAARARLFALDSRSACRAELVRRRARRDDPGRQRFERRHGRGGPGGIPRGERGRVARKRRLCGRVQPRSRGRARSSRVAAEQ